MRQLEKKTPLDDISHTVTVHDTLHPKGQHEPTLFRNRGTAIPKRQISKPLLYKHTV